MLKVLYAERAKNALTLPILSYDAPPEDAQLGDEFRKMLRRAKGTVTTENHGSLSELVAAAVTAGVMQPASPQRLAVSSRGDTHDSGEVDNQGIASQSSGQRGILVGLREARASDNDKPEGMPTELARTEGLPSHDCDTANTATLQQKASGDGEDKAAEVDVNAVQVAKTQTAEAGVTEDARGAAAAGDSAAFAQTSLGESAAAASANPELKTAVGSNAKIAEKPDNTPSNEGNVQGPEVASEILPAAQYSSERPTSTTAASTSASLKEVEAQPPAAVAGTGQGQFYARDAEIARFIAESAGSAVRRSGEASAQMLLLRQSFEHLQSHGREGISASSGASAANTNGFSSSLFASGDRARSARELNGRERGEAQPMSRNVALRMLDRVQVTLKEAARSRDGKTLSLNLEPVDLGRIKVDVSLREGALHARLTPENSQVVQALREHAHELQAALRKLGLDVERVTVTVSGEEAREDSSSDGTQLGDGKGFQEDRNNMPRNEGQVLENTFGNELAEGLGAAPEEAKSATTVWRDNWVA